MRLRTLQQNAFGKNSLEKICHALGGLDGRYHQKVCIHISKIDFISSVADELRQKHTLGPAVTFTKCNKRKTLYLQDKCSYRVSVWSV